MKKEVDIQILIRTKEKKIKLDLTKTLFGKNYLLQCNNKIFKRTVTLTEITNRVRKLLTSLPTT